MAMNVSSQGGAHNVFVYGSLLADEVVHVLLNRIPSNSPAILPGYRRFSIKGRVYPAILPVENDKVVGRVLKGVTNHELNILDIFEDVEYVRDSVELSLVHLDTYLFDSTEKVNRYADELLMIAHPVLFVGLLIYARDENVEKLKAYAYVWADKNDPNLYGDWDFEEWRSTHMNDFIKMTEEFVEEVEQPESKTRVETYDSYYNNGNDKLSIA